MSQQYFDHLLQKYLAGECTKEEEVLVNEWYQQLLDQSQLQISPEEKDIIRNRIWAALTVENGDHRTEIIPLKRTKIRTMFYRAAIAAAIIVVIAGGFFYFQPTVSKTRLTRIQDIPANLVSTSNDTKVEKEIKLLDGSIVRLHPGATIHYPKVFNTSSREVYLKGNAFFKIFHDSLRRFMVHTEGLITEVLGTSFYIHQDQFGKKLEVEVVTGKVSVYQQKRRGMNVEGESEISGIILTTNQKVTYNAANSQFITSLVEVPKVIDKYEQSDVENFVYDDVPVSRVLEQLRKAYGIDISTDNSGIGNCRFTGDIRKQDLYKKLEIICQSLPSSSYEVRGVNIIVKGKGCD